jgi:hypothetical protein
MTDITAKLAEALAAMLAEFLPDSSPVRTCAQQSAASLARAAIADYRQHTEARAATVSGEVPFGLRRELGTLGGLVCRQCGYLVAEAPPPPSAQPVAQHTTNEKLLALADRIDHERLWARRGLERPGWTQEQHDRCNAGVELRRYASFFGQDCWRVFPPRPGLSFRASTLDAVVAMARKDEARQAGIPRPDGENGGA